MMRRFMLIVAALVFASPAFAVVVDVCEVSGQYAITYTGGTDIRAFALDITVDNGATIDGISGYYDQGEGAGYGIFPGNFRDYITPVTPDYGDANYTPVAPEGDPGAAGPLDSNAITIELGALYDGEANKPPVYGNLCVLDINMPNSDCNVCVTVNVDRGGVVLNDASEAETNLPICRYFSKGIPPCYPSGLSSYQNWLDFGMPDCWCGANAINPQCAYQCYGDAGCDGQVVDWRVYSNDLTLLVNNWKKKGTDPTLNACADFDHAGQVVDWRVYSNDLTILVNNWKAKGTALDLLPPCPTQ